MSLFFKKQIFNMNKFSNHDNNMLISFLRKDFYPYKYMDDWEKLNEASLSEKEDLYSH